MMESSISSSYDKQIYTHGRIQPQSHLHCIHNFTHTLVTRTSGTGAYMADVANAVPLL